MFCSGTSIKNKKISNLENIGAKVIIFIEYNHICKEYKYIIFLWQTAKEDCNQSRCLFWKIFYNMGN